METGQKINRMLCNWLTLGEWFKKKKKRKVPKRMHCLHKLLLLPSMFFPWTELGGRHKKLLLNRKGHPCLGKPSSSTRAARKRACSSSKNPQRLQESPAAYPAWESPRENRGLCGGQRTGHCLWQCKEEGFGVTAEPDSWHSPLESALPQWLWASVSL